MGRRLKIQMFFSQGLGTSSRRLTKNFIFMYFFDEFKRINVLSMGIKRD